MLPDPTPTGWPHHDYPKPGQGRKDAAARHCPAAHFPRSMPTSRPETGEGIPRIKIDSPNKAETSRKGPVLHPVGSVVGIGRGAGDWGMRMGEIGRWKRVALPLRPWECLTEWLALGASIREKKSREWRFSPVEVGMELDGRQFGTAESGQVFQFRMEKIFWTMQRMKYTSSSRPKR